MRTPSRASISARSRAIVQFFLSATGSSSKGVTTRIAAVLFIYHGLIDWPTAGLMATGAIFGGYAGAGTARRLGQKNVRRLVIFIGLSLAASLLARQMHGGQ